MAITRAWKVYGQEGHRQRESFSPSYVYDFSDGSDLRIIRVLNSDKTGTNYYSIVFITRNTAAECEAEFRGQIDDGIFENSRVGNVEEINVKFWYTSFYTVRSSRKLFITGYISTTTYRAKIASRFGRYSAEGWHLASIGIIPRWTKRLSRRSEMLLPGAEREPKTE